MIDVDNNVEYVSTEEEADKKSIFNHFEAISEPPKKMSYYSEEASFSQEVLDVLISHLKEKIK